MAPRQGATSCRQGEEAWKHWKAGLFGDCSLSDGVIEYAKTHEENEGCFPDLPKGLRPDLPRLEGEVGLHWRVLSAGGNIRLAEEVSSSCLCWK